MISTHQTFVAILGSLLLLATTGCDNTPAPKAPLLPILNGGGGTYTFSLNPPDESVAGIDYARIRFGKWHDDGKIAFIVWTDLGGSGGSGGGSKKGSVYGHFRSNDPKKHIAYECVINSQDNNAATMTIDGQAFQLSDGNLFLVASTTDKPVIRQLKRDLSTAAVEDRYDAYKKMAETDTELQDFFKNRESDN